ncbi:Fe2+-dependent dioxygenase [Amphibiibacter pelophylacis]|uniref:Fe2+-dependent dioxygenase n=1 Tax=Amphibiibacter pelophylacis TaxID=1799477 RepID=A0ACC6P183_9BURK
MLIALPDLLSPEALAQARRLLAATPDADWVNGRNTAGHLAAHAKNNQQLPQAHATSKAVVQLVLSAIDASSAFLSAALPHRILHPQLNRYGGSGNALGAYGDHVDGAIRYQNTPHGARDTLRTDVSCTVFLSDPEDYDGGELVIADTYGEQRVRLPAGHAVVYPGTSVHRVTPVTRGQRVAAFFWIQSLVRDDGQRRLLYDMDQHLMAVRAELGEHHSATIGLAGTYHNLLRRWAET